MTPFEDAAKESAYQLGKRHAWAEMFVILHAMAVEYRQNRNAQEFLRELNDRVAKVAK